MKKRIAHILKEYRKKCNFTPEYVVNELKLNGIDIATKTLYGYEAGRNHPNADTFLCLCKIYNITSFDIFFDENSSLKHDNYENLNELGKQKADEYIDVLSENKKYTKKQNSISEDIIKELKQATSNTIINTK